MSLTKVQSVWMSSLVMLAVCASAGCKKNQPENNGAGATPTHNEPADSGVAATGPVDSGVAATPTAPRAEVPGEHCALTATLAAPATTPGPTTIEVKLDARDGFHINELDDVQLMLEGTNATVRAELARTDATESTQEGIKFVVPVQVTAANPIVRGRLRFSVCASICVRQRLSFGVALPGAT